MEKHGFAGASHPDHRRGFARQGYPPPDCPGGALGQVGRQRTGQLGCQPFLESSGFSVAHGSTFSLFQGEIKQKFSFLQGENVFGIQVEWQGDSLQSQGNGWQGNEDETEPVIPLTCKSLPPFFCPEIFLPSIPVMNRSSCGWLL
jgi:hypothetical protein